MIKVFTAFSGYDSQCMALDKIGGISYDLVGWSEIDKYAIQAHNAVYPRYADRNFGDISKIDWQGVPDFDLFTYSFPCFIKGTLVLTDKGFKEIQEVTDKDKVLTHTNSYQQVIMPMIKSYTGDIFHINAMCFDSLHCTPEHPFYVRKRYRYGHKGLRAFKNPEWLKASELTKEYYLGYAINQKAELPQWDGVIDNRYGHHKIQNNLSELFVVHEFWYLMGRYLGDGWKKNSKTGSGIIICCSKRNKESLLNALKAIGWKWNAVEERTVTKIVISSNELNAFVDRFGYKAGGKFIDAETLNLPTNLLKSLMEGLLDSDGCFSERRYNISTISRELAYGISQCVAKAYHRPSSLYKSKRKPTTIIEGRVVNQKDTYTVAWGAKPAKQDKAFYEDGYIWFPINDIEKIPFEGYVYNMSVANDESYTANGCIVHNCQDISSAGLQRGLSEGSGTRSSLLWECCKAIEAKKPKYLVMENVKALTSNKFIPYLMKWEAYLRNLGYSNFTKVLNAKDFGVPQNRERVFMVSILGDKWYNFPDGFKLKKCLRDVLEANVEEKYYLSKTITDGFIRTSQDESHGHKFIPKTGNDIAFTIRTAAGSHVDDNFVREPIMIAAMRGRDKSNSSHRGKSNENYEQKLEINKNGVANTLTSVQKDNLLIEPYGKGIIGISVHPISHKYEFNINTGIRSVSPSLRATDYKCPHCVWEKEGIEFNGKVYHEGEGLYTATTPQFTRSGLKNISRSLKANMHDAGVVENFRIRKLTPRECFRLMGVSEENIDKIQAAGISNSQQYKLAGNSIVVDVLYYIFKQLFCVEHNKFKNEPIQLSLF